MTDKRRASGLLTAPLMLACTALAGCATSPAADGSVGMPNPASVYCLKHGGTLELRNEPGGQVGYCHLPDGSVKEEWQFFRSSRS